MSRAIAPLLPPAHPVPALGELLCPRPRTASRALLEGEPGLSLSYNARGALFEIGLGLRVGAGSRTQVLLPAFHCPSGVTPLLEAGLRPVFYRVRPDLSVDWDDLLTKAGPGTRAVLVIHFFGFATELSRLQALRVQGIAVIEDWSHAFLRLDEAGRPALPSMQGDFQVFSFWKLAACGVGGGLRRLAGKAGEPAWTRAQPPWRERVVRFKREFEEALEHSPHRRSQRAFQALEALRTGTHRGAAEAALAPTPAQPPPRGEDRYPFDPVLARACMPGNVRKRLLGTNLAALVKQRRAHYALLAEHLPSTNSLQPLRPKLDASTCPWVFPLRVVQRDRFDRSWRAQGVALHTFGIWLHSAVQQSDAATLADAELLAAELLCLSVHQGLSSKDIERCIAVIGDHTQHLPHGAAK